ncbi:MAG: hypothetical protein SGCHY_001844 [Lobulomycetales sp.]
MTHRYMYGWMYVRMVVVHIPLEPRAWRCDDPTAKGQSGGNAISAVWRRSQAHLWADLFAAQLYAKDGRAVWSTSQLLVTTSFGSFIRETIDNFSAFKTSEYKLCYHQTPSNMKLVLICSPKASTATAKEALKQIYAKFYVELIVLNGNETDDKDGDDKSPYLSNSEFAEAVKRYLVNLRLLE